ncbi:hypothetical protein LTR56_002440 [Elasticomyces elasticus]|nr:hypothetical protein LTR56_002440 [Elasticomyces elasticus]KAK5753740.1 hypothetical protein LTS12_016155 [Elasticomyces elasticus]
MDQITTWLSQVRDISPPNDPDLAIFVPAGILFIATSSLLCSTTESDLSKSTKITVQGIWTLCAATFSTQSRLPGLIASTLRHGALPYLVGSVVMFWLAREILKTIQSISAAYLAKHTILWKLYHVRRGTYESAIGDLHQLYGAIVQVGPREYSISDPLFFERCARFEKALLSTSNSKDGRTTSSYRLLAKPLRMANVFLYERDIEACTKKLMDTLAGFAATGETVNMSDLITCYAYDTMFATTTGQEPRFLARPMDASGIKTAMENWKFYSVLYGSYLRFHPIITRAFNLIFTKPEPAAEIASHLETDSANVKRGILAFMRKASADITEDDNREMLTACIAMVTAGSDPLITHILTSLHHIYSDPKLLKGLRKEIDQAHIWQPPKLKFVLQRRNNLPLLQAVLKETLRLHQPARPSYVTPEGGIWIDETHVPEGCTICLETSAAHLDPDMYGDDAAAWRPERWLSEDPPVTSHMLAFGSSSQHCPGEDLHYALLTKLLVYILPNINLEMAATEVRRPAPLKFHARVSLPTTSTLRMPATPLRATAPSFAPETTTAPMLPPGLTPISSTFGLATLAQQGVQSFSNFLAGNNNVSFAVPNNNWSTTQVANANANGSAGRTSPALSTSSTSSNVGISTNDQKTLVRVIGYNTTNEFISRFDPSQDFTGRKPLITRGMPNKAHRKELHDLVERLFPGRLETKTNNRNNRVTISPVSEAQQHRRQVAAEQAKQAKHFGGFHSAEARAEYDAKIAEGAARYAADFEAKRATMYKMYEDHQKEREFRPKVEIQQTFKDTSNNKTRGNLLGAARIPGRTVETVVGATGSDNEGVKLPTDSTDKPADKETAVAEKKAFVPPHLRKKVAEAAALAAVAVTIQEPVVATSPVTPPPVAIVTPTSPPRSYTPPHLRNRSISPPATRSDSVCSTTEWVAAKLPNISY